MYYSPTESEQLHCQLGAKNRGPIEVVDQIILTYLSVDWFLG